MLSSRASNPAALARATSRKAAAMAIGTTRPVVCNFGRHSRAWSRRAASGVCQQPPGGLVTGCRLNSGEKMAGPGKLALPHFGARSFAFSFGWPRKQRLARALLRREAVAGRHVLWRRAPGIGALLPRPRVQVQLATSGTPAGVAFAAASWSPAAGGHQLSSAHSPDAGVGSARAADARRARSRTRSRTKPCAAVLQRPPISEPRTRSFCGPPRANSG